MRDSHEWYQTDSQLVVSVFIKNVQPEQATVEIQPNAVRWSEYDHSKVLS